jgi:DNA-binding IclR family transcriptional regulator
MRRRREPIGSADAAPAAADHAATVDSLQRGLEALRCFQSGEDALPTVEIARRLGLTRATTRRLLMTLAAQGFLQCGSDGDTFGLHVASFVVGQAMLSGSPLVRAARSQLQALTARFPVHALLCVGDRGELLVLVHQAGAAAPPWLLGAGARLPVGDTALGHAWLWMQSSVCQGEFLARLREKTTISVGLAPVWKAFHDLEISGTCSSVWSGRGGVELTAAPVLLHDGTMAVLACVKVGMQVVPDAACALALRQTADAIREDVRGNVRRR